MVEPCIGTADPQAVKRCYAFDASVEDLPVIGPAISFPITTSAASHTPNRSKEPRSALLFAAYIVLTMLQIIDTAIMLVF
jgi:hypothetical protein